MNLDHDFFRVSNWSEEQKKGLHQKWNTFFPRLQVKTKKKSSPKMEPGALPEIRKGGGGLIFGSGSGASSRRRPVGAGGMEAKPPALENFEFFFKNSLILELF